MRIVILGSSGQIGAYLTDYLRNKGHEVTEFDVVNGGEEDLTKIPNTKLQILYFFWLLMLVVLGI
jgi:nucleoside-diphosphate-sugar epimerase